MKIQNKRHDEYTPFIVKFIGVIVCMLIGFAIGGLMFAAAIDWYVDECKPGCTVERLLYSM